MSATRSNKRASSFAANLASTPDIEGLRAEFEDGKSASARTKLFEALVAFGAESLARDAAAATSALAEAAALVPSPLPADIAWQSRVVNLRRIRAALAQRQERHADAVMEFEAALAQLPADRASAGRDANAARLQLLVRLARSRLALGQAAAVAAEMAECETLLAELSGLIPAPALDTARAAVLANFGVALAMTGDVAGAEQKFESGIALIDRLGSRELSPLRDQMLAAWTGALRAKGRGADAEDVLARMSVPGHHAHGDACGCGHDHHDHGHAHHGHDHHGHHHAHDHEHEESCGCGSHAH